MLGEEIRQQALETYTETKKKKTIGRQITN